MGRNVLFFALPIKNSHVCCLLVLIPKGIYVQIRITCSEDIFIKWYCGRVYFVVLPPAAGGKKKKQLQKFYM
jgi:hypothetical protein